MPLTDAKPLGHIVISSRKHRNVKHVFYLKNVCGPLLRWRVLNNLHHRHYFVSEIYLPLSYFTKILLAVDPDFLP